MSKKILPATLLFLFGALTQAQVVEDNKPGERSNVFTKVEIEAGTNPKAWADHVRKNIQLPDSVSKNIPPGTYKVNVQFIVDRHGNIGQVKAKNDPGYGLAKRAEKIILTYKGIWQPASQCGRNVNAYKQQPITFVIPDLNSQPNS